MVNVSLPLREESAFHELVISHFLGSGEGGQKQSLDGGILNKVRTGPHPEGTSLRRNFLASAEWNVFQLHSIEVKSKTLFSFLKHCLIDRRP